MRSQSQKTALKMDFKKCFTVWAAGRESLPALLYYLLVPCAKFPSIPGDESTELVYDWMTTVVEGLPTNDRKMEARNNMHVIRRFIAAYEYSLSLREAQTADVLLPVSPESLKELLFYISALFVMLDQGVVKGNEAANLREWTENVCNLFNETVVSRLNRTQQARMADHIATDTSYPLEMKNMISKKTATPKTSKTPKSTGKGKPARTTNTPAPAPTPVPSPAPVPPQENGIERGSVLNKPLTPYEKRMQAKMAAVVEPAPPPSPLLELANEIANKTKPSAFPAPSRPWPIEAIKPEPRTWCIGKDLYQQNSLGKDELVQENSPACGYTPQIVDKDTDMIDRGPTSESAGADVASCEDPPLSHHDIVINAAKEFNALSSAFTRLIDIFVAEPKNTKEEWKNLVVELGTISTFAQHLTTPYDEEMYAREKPVVDNQLILEAFEGVAGAVQDVNNRFEKLKGLLGKK